MATEEFHLSATLQVTRNRTIRLNVVPEKVGHFSVEKKQDGGRVFHDDQSELRVLKLPLNPQVVNYNLLKDYVSLSDGGKNYSIIPDNSLGEILEWIIKHREVVNQGKVDGERCLKVDFVSSRGTQWRIMLMPFMAFEKVVVCATLFKGTIYLHRYNTEEEADEEYNKESYAGHRFEQYITIPAFPEETREMERPGELHDYFTVIETSLGNLSMLYNSQMDCVGSRTNLDNVMLHDFVEIKTTILKGDTKKNLQISPFKAAKWWCQSYLSGTEKILCGYRVGHTVEELKWVPVGLLPVEPLPSEDPYQVCLNLLHRFLNHVKSVVTEDNHKCVYKFSWSPIENLPRDENDRGNITCLKTYSDEFRILPDWYADEIETIQ